MEHIITKKLMNSFLYKMFEEEKSEETIKKYCRDLKKFYEFVGENSSVTKRTVIEFKQYLKGRYEIRSSNTIISVLNCFFEFAGWYDCKVKFFKVQNDAFRAPEREINTKEYRRLLETAKSNGQTWLYYTMVTIAATGIRISELKFITVEAIKIKRARVINKGKTRQVIIPSRLCKELKQYAKKKRISSGSIFVTRNGKPIDRSNIHHAMKKLCRKAGVEKTKVFPHNLRHLFAICYYERYKDLSGLASILGHSSIDTTRIYIMTTIDKKEERINDLKIFI